MDLEKLTPAPWRFVGENVPGLFGKALLPSLYGPDQLRVAKVGTDDVKRTEELGKRFVADAAFIALARNAFDVMMRRGWSPWAGKEWSVLDDEGGMIYRKHGGDGSRITASDPFTALVEADKWYKENVEGQK